MPRLRLAESTNKRHKSSAPKSNNEFGSTEGLEKFNDFDFNFDVKSGDERNGVVERGSSTAVQNSSVGKLDNPYKKNSTPTPMSTSPIQSPTISTKRITVKDLAKKPNKSGKSSNSKSGGYTKLFNSSSGELNNENELIQYVDSKKSKLGSKMKKKRQSVSIDESDDSSIDLQKSSGRCGKSNGGNIKRGKKAEPPQSVFSDEELSDTDEDEAKAATKVRVNPTKTKGTVKKSLQPDAAKLNAARKGKGGQAAEEEIKSRPRLKSSTPVSVRSNILPHRAVAVDNRALPTIAGDSMTRQFLSRIGEFILDGLDNKVFAASRAVGNTVIASFVKGASVGVQALNLLEGLESKKLERCEQKNWLSNCMTPINCEFGSVIDDEAENGFDYGDCCVDIEPIVTKDCNVEGFRAKNSWSYFGDMLEAARCKVNSSKDKSNYLYELSIFTTDAVLFADTNPDSHLTAFNLFQKRISKGAVRKIVSAVTIVISDATNAIQVRESTRGHNSFQDNRGGTLLPNRLQILQCINPIRRRIQELSDTAMKIRLEFVDGSSVDYQTLQQMWMRESLAQTYQATADIDSIDGKIQFELPETIDGTMCSISLDLQYTVLPDHIDSQSTIDLIRGMKTLSSLAPHSVEVLQTVPLASVDSSLIHGVPMYARPGLEHDLVQYNQMKILVRQLWKYLSRNDVALVLRVRRQVQDEKGVSKTTSRSQYELFLLTAQIAVEKQSIPLNPSTSMQSSSALDIIPDRHRKGESPCQGILYRYATKNQILYFGKEEPDPRAEEEDNTAEVAEYADYIERSMDMLTSSGLNPFLVGESQSYGGFGFSQSQDSSSIH